MSGASPALMLGGAQAVGGLAGSIAGNRGVRRAERSARGSAQVEANQTARSAALERVRRRREADALRARIRVLSSASGTGVGGSVAATINQATLDEATDLEIMRLNEEARIAEINAGLRARLIGLNNQRSNPFASALNAGLSGYTTGLALETGFERRDQYSAPLDVSTTDPRVITPSLLPPRPEF